MKALDLAEVSFHNVDASGSVPGDKKKADQAVPGKPSCNFYTGVAK